MADVENWAISTRFCATAGNVKKAASRTDASLPDKRNSCTAIG